jgi:hypothetical protein
MRYAKVCSGILLAFCFNAAAQSLAPFSDTQAWSAFTFAKTEFKTVYKLERDAERGAIMHAIASKSASALKQPFEAPAEKLSALKWSWNIATLPTGGSTKQKETDDYAARVYVAFTYDPEKVSVFTRAQFGLIKAIYGRYPPSAALSYIVDPELPVGTIVNSPYTPRVKMIVVDDGKALGKWQSFERNIAADYQRAFGTPPMTPVEGIIIMSDADNTQTRADAKFGPISLSVIP